MIRNYPEKVSIKSRNYWISRKIVKWNGRFPVKKISNIWYTFKADHCNQNISLNEKCSFFSLAAIWYCMTVYQCAHFHFLVISITAGYIYIWVNFFPVQSRLRWSWSSLPCFSFFQNTWSQSGQVSFKSRCEVIYLINDIFI